MKLSGVCVLVSAVWAVIGIVPGVWMQMELWAPGLQLGNAQFVSQTYQVSGVVHGAVMGIALPLTLVAALGAALFAEQRGGRLWRVLAVTYLVLAGVVVLAAVLPHGGRLMTIGDGVLRIAVLGAAIMGALLVGLSYPRFRVTMILFSAGAGLALLVAGLLAWLFVTDGVDLALADTVLVAAQQHAMGVAMVLLSAGVLTVWAGHERVGVSSLMSLLICCAMLASGWMMVGTQAQLGLAGMPRGYPDYPSNFAALQLRAGIGAFLFTAVTVATLVRLATIMRLPRAGISDAFI